MLMCSEQGVGGSWRLSTATDAGGEESARVLRALLVLLSIETSTVLLVSQILIGLQANLQLVLRRNGREGEQPCCEGTDCGISPREL